LEIIPELDEDLDEEPEEKSEERTDLQVRSKDQESWDDKINSRSEKSDEATQNCQSGHLELMRLDSSRGNNNKEDIESKIQDPISKKFEDRSHSSEDQDLPDRMLSMGEISIESDQTIRVPHSAKALNSSRENAMETLEILGMNKDGDSGAADKLDHLETQDASKICSKDLIQDIIYPQSELSPTQIPLSEAMSHPQATADPPPDPGSVPAILAETVIALAHGD